MAITDTPLDTVWVLISACIVLLAQLGFVQLELATFRRPALRNAEAQVKVRLRSCGAAEAAVRAAAVAG